MKKILFAVTLFLSANTFAQTITDKETPYIEVVGSAEKEVIPDEIFLRIVLRERYEGKEKITIDKQESNLKAALKNIGIDVAKNLSLADADADYVKVKWNKKDVVSQKGFSLKVADATTVGKVFEQLDELKIKDANITKTNYSKLDSLKKEIRIEAIKNAKDKATYLLAAIGEQIGKPLMLFENNYEVPVYNTVRYKANTEVMLASDANGGAKEMEAEVEFQKIKVISTINTRFAIK